MPVIKYIRDNLVLFGALAANLGIAIAKFIAANITGSSSMISEGIHSVVDSLNQVLLLYGEHRADRPADKEHPFGYGRELYFWAFVVAILIFAVGAGVSFYEGYIHYLEPEKLTNPTINYIVLFVAFGLEATSWLIAMRKLAASKGDIGWWAAVRRSKDPSIFIVVFEDSAALAGLIVAGIGVSASHWFDAPQLDGLASMVIGVILAMVALILARETKGLLIGERADSQVIDHVRETVQRKEWVSEVNHVRTIHTSARQVFVAISADIVDDITVGEAETLIKELEQQLKDQLPQLTSIYIRPEKKEDALKLPDF
jgi:cation diffusion facilitator family transporter